MTSYATRRVVLAAAALGLLGLGAWIAVAYVQPRREAREMRDELRAQRRVVDSCRMALSRAEADFREYDETVDSLRDRVRSYEDLHEEGVPADSFRAYLRAVDRYNEAVPRWESRAEDLQERNLTCRNAVRRHNALADSLRELLARIPGGGGS